MEAKQNLIAAITKRLNTMDEQALRAMFIIADKMKGGDT